LRYTNTEVVVEVDSPSGAMLVLNDVWHPWWRATIDGIETEILRANAIVRAVQVAPGNIHRAVRNSEPLRGAVGRVALADVFAADTTRLRG
jgi:hypothetical protein